LATKRVAQVIPRVRDCVADFQIGLSGEVNRLVLKTMAGGPPKARTSGSKAAAIWQRVEDNAFHLKCSKVDRLVLKTMVGRAPKAQISGPEGFRSNPLPTR
jgi:hypothetical protein